MGRYYTLSLLLIGHPVKRAWSETPHFMKSEAKGEGKPSADVG